MVNIENVHDIDAIEPKECIEVIQELKKEQAHHKLDIALLRRLLALQTEQVAILKKTMDHHDADLAWTKNRICEISNVCTVLIKEQDDLKSEMQQYLRKKK